MGTDAGDDFNVDSGTLIVEGDTGNVGIGGASPGEKLYVAGNLRISSPNDLLLDTNGGSVEWLSVGGTRRGKIASDGDGVQFYGGQTPVEIFSLPASEDQLKMIGSASILWETDNSGDIGASGATRPRDLHLGRNAIIGGKVGIGAAPTGSLLEIHGADWNTLTINKRRWSNFWYTVPR